MPLLPGTPGERISDLCNGRHISQKELAKRIGVSAPQLSRIVSGETKTLSSDILIAVAFIYNIYSAVRSIVRMVKRHRDKQKALDKIIEQA